MKTKAWIVMMYGGEIYIPEFCSRKKRGAESFLKSIFYERDKTGDGSTPEAGYLWVAKEDGIGHAYLVRTDFKA